jgi:hypothetical protein
MAVPIDSVLQFRLSTAEGGEMMFEAAAFVLDLLGGANAHLPQKGDRWAPTLEGVLEEKGLDNDW